HIVPAPMGRRNDSYKPCSGNGPTSDPTPRQRGVRPLSRGGLTDTITVDHTAVLADNLPSPGWSPTDEQPPWNAQLDRRAVPRLRASARSVLRRRPGTAGPVRQLRDAARGRARVRPRGPGLRLVAGALPLRPPRVALAVAHLAARREAPLRGRAPGFGI